MAKELQISLFLYPLQDGDNLALTTFLFEDGSQWKALEVPRAEVPAPCW